MCCVAFQAQTWATDIAPVTYGIDTIKLTRQYSKTQKNSVVIRTFEKVHVSETVFQYLGFSADVKVEITTRSRQRV